MGYRELVDDVLRQMGRARIENQPRPDMAQSQSEATISAIFVRDCARHQFETDVRKAGGPRIATNDAGLGRDRNILGRVLDWLR
jgi:hypothetical protein